MTDKQGAPTLQEVIQRFADSAEKLDQLSAAATRLGVEADKQASAAQSLEESRIENARIGEVLSAAASELKSVAADVGSLTQSVIKLIDASDNTMLVERIASVERLCEDLQASAARESELRNQAMSTMVDSISAKIDVVFDSLPKRWKKKSSDGTV